MTKKQKTKNKKKLSYKTKSNYFDYIAHTRCATANHSTTTVYLSLYT